MENRLNTSKKLLSQGEGLSCYPRKNKKRSNRKSALLNNWINDGQRDQSNGMMSNMEYSQVLWQPEMQQNLPNQNGQRLFAAVSDPSVCGYSPLPMTYTVEPVSLPTMYRLYQPVPLPGVRTIHNRPRQNFNQTHTMPMHPNPRVMPNGYTSLQDNKADSSMLSSYQNGDYASLPPTANKSNGVNEEELNSEHRRYSDPGLGPTEPQVHSHSDDSDSVDSESSITTIGRSNKLVLSLIEQMTELKKSNGQLFKELNETKFELENMKAKLTQYKHSVSSDYQPGMLSDLIREIREANKLCEEGLVAKVQLIVEERHKQKSTEVEQLRTQLLKLAKEKEESDKRISKLEKEVATLKVHASNEGREIAAFEEETLALRRELQEALATRSHAADGHATKCVNARSVTPVTFEAPLVSSTPVRTALADTCSLVTAISSSIPCTSVLPQVRASNRSPFCTRDAPTTTTSSSSSSAAAVAAAAAATAAAVVNNIPTCKLESTLEEERKEYIEEREQIFIPESMTRNGEGGEVKSKLENKRNNVERAEDRFEEEQSRRKNSMEEDQSESAKENRKNEEIDDRTKTSNGNREIDQVHEQRGSLKKSKKRRSGVTLVKRSSSDSDKLLLNNYHRWSNGGGEPSSSSSSSSTTGPSEWNPIKGSTPQSREARDKEERERSIADVPEVTVIDGTSFVPKDLCSTSILTSRVLTAPSRATYTTAYL